MSLVVAGAIWGIAGTAALSCFESWETRVLGRPPVYTARNVALRAFALDAPRQASLGTALGLLLRWTYGPAIGSLYALLRPASARLPLGVALGVGIYVFELSVAPRVGAVPPLREWPRAELGMLFCHILVYGLTTELCAELLSR